jgi:hypothetical protein
MRPTRSTTTSSVLAVTLVLLPLACRHPAPPIAEPRTAPVVRPPAERPISSGLDVLRRVREAHDDSAPSLISFTQATTTYLASGGQLQQRWRIIVAPPLRMRSDYLPLTTRSGALQLGVQNYSFQNGRRTSLQTQVNATLLLGFGAFAQAPESTMRHLDSLGVKSTVIRRDTAGGRPVWVIGAEAGDLTSDQLWVDAQRWIPIRLIDRETRGTRTTITDYRFSEFAEHGGVPIVTTLLIYRDQRLTVRYEHRDVRINPAVSDAAFDPARWVEGQPPLPATTPSTTPRGP